MKLSAEHEFAAPAATVAALVVNPEFEVAVALPDLSTPEVVAHAVEGTETVLQLRYEFIGYMDPIAKRVVAGDRLTWVQEMRMDLEQCRGQLSITADQHSDRVKASARVHIRDTPEGCVRTIEGDFVVRIPLIGGMAERKIGEGILVRLDVEAEAIRSHLA